MDPRVREDDGRWLGMPDLIRRAQCQCFSP